MNNSHTYYILSSNGKTMIKSDFRGLVDMVKGWLKKVPGEMAQNVFYQNLMRLLKGNGYSGTKANKAYEEMMAGTPVETALAASVQITSHKGKPHLEYYYTPEEIEYYHIDEYGRPHPELMDDPDYDLGEWQKDAEEDLRSELKEGALDVTSDEFTWNYEDFEQALRENDYKEAMNLLHDMGYSSEDVVDLLTDVKEGRVTFKDLFSRVKLNNFLKNSSAISLQKISDTLIVSAEKINPVKRASKLVQFTTKTVPFASITALESCWNLNSASEIRVPSTALDFQELVSILSAKSVAPVISESAFVNTTSELKIHSDVAKVVKDFSLPEATSQVYSRVKELSLNF